jgi:hypothetical protein
VALNLVPEKNVSAGKEKDSKEIRTQGGRSEAKPAELTQLCINYFT